MSNCSKCGTCPTINVHTFADLRSYWPDVPDFPCCPGLTVENVIEDLGIPEEKLVDAFINDQLTEYGSLLKPGDDLRLFPAARVY